MRQHAATRTICTLNTLSWVATVRCMGGHPQNCNASLCNVNNSQSSMTRDSSSPIRGKLHYKRERHRMQTRTR
eukprot:15099-Heterococcus_DN1.PRE.2